MAVELPLPKHTGGRLRLGRANLASRDERRGQQRRQPMLDKASRDMAGGLGKGAKGVKGEGKRHGSRWPDRKADGRISECYRTRAAW
ncbi:hypothetical protein CS8_013590 [Cupriavidus sp. 8B]